MAPRKIHVAHFTGSMIVGGVPTWLVHVFKHADTTRFSFSLGIELRGGPLESEVRQHGIEMFSIPRPLAITLSPSNVMSELVTRRPDIVHCYDTHSGPLLKAAARAGIAHRLVHIRVHRYLPTWLHPYRRLTMHLAWYWARRYATRLLACSKWAAKGCLGEDWAEDPRITVLYNAIDLKPFTHSNHHIGAQLRADLSIPKGSVVIGHVGRLSEEKNHAFILRLSPDILKAIPNAHIVFIGDGPLRSAIEAEVAKKGLASRIHLLGTRLDAPSLMLNFLDVLLFPSRSEGFGNVMLEAQAAGLPVVCATTITDEAVVIPKMVQRLDLRAPARDWIRAIRSAVELRSRVDQESCLRTLMGSEFNMENSVRRLEAIYEEMMGSQ